MDNSRIFAEIESELSNNGVVKISNLLDLDLINSLRERTLEIVEIESEKLETQDHVGFGRILFAPVYGGPYLELLEQKHLIEIAKNYMGASPILYTMTSSCIPPNKSNYTGTIHRDSHLPTGCVRLIIMQVLLDDFTEDNGAPLFLKGSQKEGSEPDTVRFENEAKLITGKKGDIILFDPWIWHRSTKNDSSEWRSCVLLGFVHPWMKQRFDVKTMLESTDLSGCSEDALNVLGLNSYPPKSWDEFYKNDSSVYR